MMVIRLIIIRDSAAIDVAATRTVPIQTTAIRTETRIGSTKIGPTSKQIRRTIITKINEIRINSTVEGHEKSGQAKSITVTTDDAAEMTTIVDVVDSVDEDIFGVVADITTTVNDAVMVTGETKTTTKVQNRIYSK